MNTPYFVYPVSYWWTFRFQFFTNTQRYCEHLCKCLCAPGLRMFLGQWLSNGFGYSLYNKKYILSTVWYPLMYTYKFKWSKNFMEQSLTLLHALYSDVFLLCCVHISLTYTQKCWSRGTNLIFIIYWWVMNCSF